MFARQPDALPDDGWNLLIDGASRLFDNLTEVETDFYAGAVTDALKAYDGTGTGSLLIAELAISQLIRSVTIEANAYPVPPFEVGTPLTGGGNTLDILDSSVWESGFVIFIDAEWAPTFDTVPPDVTSAVIELVLHEWRKRDPAFASISNAENSVLLQPIPPTVQATVDKLKAAYSQRCLFA